MMLRLGKHPATLAFCFLLGIATARPACTQEFEPRTYTVTPSGLNFLAIVYGFSGGAVLMDPALPTEDVEGDVHLVIARYVRTFGFFEQPSRLKVTLPWSSGHWEGDLDGEFPQPRRSRSRRPSYRFRDALVGPEANPPGIASDDEGPIVWGARLQLVAPTGDYDSDRAFNLGSNRWTFIPEVGLGWTIGNWSIEAAIAEWISRTTTTSLAASCSSRTP